MTVDPLSLLAQVRANQTALDGCAGHQFERVQAGRLFSKYRCHHCGGTADADFASGYQQGLAHGQILANQQALGTR